MDENRLTPDQGKRLLKAFSEFGFESVYGSVLRAVDERLTAISIRPLIETTGPEIFVSLDRATVIVCKVPKLWRQLRNEIAGVVEFVIVEVEKDSSTAEALARVCDSVLGAPLYSGLFQEMIERAVLRSSVSRLSQTGDVLAQDDVRAICRQLYGTLGKALALDPETEPRQRSNSAPRTMPRGLWLESLVADVLVDANQENHAGVNIGIDECDVIAAPFGRVILIECKDSSLKLNDISTAKEKANRVGADCFLFVVTGREIHPNVRKFVHIWDEDAYPIEYDRMEDFPRCSAIVVESEEQIRTVFNQYLHLVKLDELRSWILSDDSHPMVPWFPSHVDGGESVVYCRDWYSDPETGEDALG